MMMKFMNPNVRQTEEEREREREREFRASRASVTAA